MSTFQTIGINKELTSLLEKQGITVPTKVQEQAIPLILQKQHLICQAKTGTGKTLAYALPTIQQLHKKYNLSLLIVVPTKELAYQIKGDLEPLTTALDLKIAVFTGGKPKQSDSNILQRRNQVIIGTTGRLIDYINEKKIRLSDLKFIVLDETDKILDMGFIQDASYLLSRCPKLCQKLLFSATQDPHLLESIEEHFQSAKIIHVEQKIIPDGLKQYFTWVKIEEKRELLLTIMHKERKKSVLIFCNKKKDVDDLVDFLNSHEFKAKAMHGDFTSIERKNVFYLFKEHKINVLVATDLASRGLHNEDIALVINYDVPKIASDYVHRIGRTARLDKQGTSITFVCPEDGERKTQVEEYTDSKMELYSK